MKLVCKDCLDPMEDCRCLQDTVDFKFYPPNDKLIEASKRYALNAHKVPVEYFGSADADLYSKVETFIIKWNLDGTRTAEDLTREFIQLIMKNIHVLPTDKPSRLILQTNGVLRLSEITFKGQIASGVTQNIYITNDEEIKEGDWCVDDIGDVFKIEYLKYWKDFCKKIILTTDQDLIKDGVQAIDDEFLEWFVKNPSCEEVEVMPYLKDIINPLTNEKYSAVQHRYFDESKMIFEYHYKIIIPKEELLYAWVGVMNDEENNYIPYQYELKYIYQGKDCLPNFKTKEECQYWCDNDSPFAIPKEEPVTLGKIIPKERVIGLEEPKQETLEEAAKKSFGEIWSSLTQEQSEYLKDFINRQREDAKKWQQKDVLKLLKANGYEDEPIFDLISEQFKKK